MNLDDIKINDMKYILNEDTTLSRYFSLIPMKNIIIERLLSAHIIYKSQFDDMYENNFSKLKDIVACDNEIVEKFHKALHLHDFKNRSIKNFISLDEKFLAKLISKGYKKSYDVLLLASENSMEYMAEFFDETIDNTDKLISMCHLMRLPGVKDTRASLYYDAGLKKLQYFSKYSYEEIYDKIHTYINKSACRKSMPQRKELLTQIAVSKILP